MEATILTKVVLPLALFTIMLGMGLSLVWDDFRRVAKQPRAFAIGLICQLVLLPLIGYGIAKLFDMPPLLGMGLVVLALCPGGTTSNLFSFLARGDVALSISLTAVSSLITPFSVPLLAAFAMRGLMGSSQAIELPLLKTILTLLVITVLPVAIGMFLKRRAPALSARAERPVKIFSLVFLAAIIAGILRQNWPQVGSFFAQVGWAALALNVTTMSLGYVIALTARLKKKQAVTIGLEVGVQNGTTALFITTTVLASPAMSISPAIYSLIMFGTASVFALLVNLGGKRQSESLQAAEG